MIVRTLFTGRYIIASGFTLVVIFSLFWVMQYLISITDWELDKDDPGRMLEFIRVAPEEVVIRPEPTPKPEPLKERPPEPLPPSMDKITANTTPIHVSPPQAVNPVNFNDTISEFSEGEYLPIVIVQPNYPRRAIARDIEGYAIVELTVTKLGTTRDIRVIEAVPTRIFDKASLAAAARFKYKPRVIGGQPIEVPGVQYMFTFELEE